MSWHVKHDRDAFKEVWLLFENADGRFPLYPGETTWISYVYTRQSAQVGAMVGAGHPVADPPAEHDGDIPGPACSRWCGGSRRR